MKILIAHDGSDCADAALDDLQRAGLPETAELLVLSVAEVDSPLRQFAVAAATPGYDSVVETRNHQRQADAQALAVQVAGRLRTNFPRWKISTQAMADSAPAVIERKAINWKPDLIVMGSHGRSGFKRLALGSVSHHVLNHTTCSVRIGRFHAKAPHRPIRILIGADGSPDSAAALKSVASRQWPSGTEVRVVSAADSGAWLLTAAAALPQTMCVPAVEDELIRQASDAARQAVEDLRAHGLIATARTYQGNPAEVIINEAEEWDADCIFVGARGLGGIGRTILGSVSTMVALNASCSVEIVRHPAQTGA